MVEATSMKSVDFIVWALSIFAIFLLLYSPFGPISDEFIPYHPIGWAGILTYSAMVLSFGHKYQKTKDKFWLILITGFFPLLISDLYFFPIPEFYGLGMLEWVGAQFVVLFFGFTFYSHEKILRYSNLVMLVLTPFAGVATLLPQENTFLNPFKILSLLVLIVATWSLSYYAFQQKNYLFIIGTILNFMIADLIIVMYFITGSIIFGWEHLFMAVVTDRMAIFGRALMALSASHIWILRKKWESK